LPHFREQAIDQGLFFAVHGDLVRLPLKNIAQSD
jgi:hypothetical protein